MIVFPNAKINLGLNIIAKRDDGYHNLETIFYPIKIYDALEAIKSEQLTFSSSGMAIPGDQNQNLCIKAYELLIQDFNLPPLQIHLHKNIPVGAGLGGGSADAAFSIKLINRMFDLCLNDQQMEKYTKQLGADCAFFIGNKPVFATGKGDEFEDLKLDLSNYYLVLVMPPVQVSTAEAYAGVKPNASIIDLREAINNPITLWKDLIANDFEKSVSEKYPQIKAIKEALYQQGALYAAMSGSGASVFGIFSKKPDLFALEQTNQVFYNI